ncbi:YbaN family protein [Chloroflexota bacterium]
MLRRRILVIAGTILTGIGIIGIFVPILPTTPFLLLAAACYLRSSRRFYNWLLGNRFFGIYVKNYLEGKGMPLKLKISVIALLWITVGLLIGFLVEHLAVKIILVVIHIAVTIHIILIKTAKGNL